MELLLLIDFHVDDGSDVDVGTDDDHGEVGSLLVPQSWPGIVC